jgi:hypothetical protein
LNRYRRVIKEWSKNPQKIACFLRIYIEKITDFFGIHLENVGIVFWDFPNSVGVFRE